MFTICGVAGFTMSGTGTLKVVNGVITITDTKSDRKVNIQYNGSSLTGRAILAKISGPGLGQNYSITDTNPHPVCQCGS